MYDLASIARRIKKYGVDVFIRDLCSNTFSPEVIKQMTASHILCDGYPNLSLIYSLAS